MSQLLCSSSTQKVELRLPLGLLIVFLMSLIGEKFPNLPTNKNIQGRGFDPIYAQCYLGGTRIAAAFKGGADIVVCGRVTDASVTAGVAMLVET